MNEKNQKDNYIKTLLENHPNAITGNNIVTATAIAKEFGIPGNDVNLKKLEKKDIEEYPEQMDEKIKRIIINFIRKSI